MPSMRCWKALLDRLRIQGAVIQCWKVKCSSYRVKDGDPHVQVSLRHAIGNDFCSLLFLTSAHNFEKQQKKSLLAVEVTCPYCRNCCWGLIRSCVVFVSCAGVAWFSLLDGSQVTFPKKLHLIQQLLGPKQWLKQRKFLLEYWWTNAFNWSHYKSFLRKHPKSKD